MPRFNAWNSGMPAPDASTRAKIAAASLPRRLPAGTRHSLKVTSPPQPCCHGFSCLRTLSPGASAGTNSTLGIDCPGILARTANNAAIGALTTLSLTPLMIHSPLAAFAATVVSAASVSTGR